MIVGAALVGLALVIAIFVRDAQTPPTPKALPLTKTFDDSPTGFTFQYPDDWAYAIPTLGVLVVAPQPVLSGSEAGPTLTVQRAEPLSIVGSLDAALERYLRNGPLRVAGRWTITSPAQPVEFAGRGALSVEVEGADAANAPAYHSRILAAAADNSIVYFFVASVPVEKRAAHELTLEAMLDTVQLLE